MRRRYIYDKTLDKMVEIDIRRPKYASHMIFDDISPFQSPVDGKVISSRSGLRSYMKQHNLAHADDFKETWAKKSAERRKFMNGAQDSKSKTQRISALRDTFEILRNRQRAGN